MTAVAQTPEESPAPRPIHVLPSSEHVLGSKVNTVLRILNSVTPMLCSQPVGENWTDRELEKVFDGGSCDAAQVTYIKACDRLDKLLDDDSLWKIGEQDEILNAGAREIAGVQLKTAQLRHALTEDAARPCRRFPTKLKKVGSKFHVTFKAKESATAIVGVGRTVVEAMGDFDKKYFGQQPEQKS